MKEIWKDIPEWYGKYQVSNMGNVRKSGKIITRIDGIRMTIPPKNMKTQIGPDGYPKLTLHRGDQYRTYTVHRLVATTFIPNPNNKPEVNHINGVKSDNCVENLEWVTRSENYIHSRDVIKTAARRTPIKCVETGECFPSLSNAAKSKNLRLGNLIQAVSPKYRAKTCGGYHWEYI